MALFKRYRRNPVTENRFKSGNEQQATSTRKEEHSERNRERSGDSSFRWLNPLVAVHRLLDGSLLTNEYVVRNIPLILFITVLGIIYITNSATAERNRRELLNATDELKELRYKYISTKSSVMYLSNQSQISKRLKEKGIKENTVPPVKIFTGEHDIQKPGE